MGAYPFPAVEKTGWAGGPGMPAGWRPRHGVTMLLNWGVVSLPRKLWRWRAGPGATAPGEGKAKECLNLLESISRPHTSDSNTKSPPSPKISVEAHGIRCVPQVHWLRLLREGHPPITLRGRTNAPTAIDQAASRRDACAPNAISSFNVESRLIILARNETHITLPGT